MDLWKVLFVGFISTISLCSSEKESDIQEARDELLRTSKKNDTKEISKCICFSKKKSGINVSNYLKFDGRGLERLVLYLYKPENDRHLSIYIPNQEKQSIFPDLMYDDNDLIIPTGEISVDAVFVQGLNIVSSNNVPDEVNLQPNNIIILPDAYKRVPHSDIPRTINNSVNYVAKVDEKILDDLIITLPNNQSHAESPTITKNHHDPATPLNVYPILNGPINNRNNINQLNKLLISRNNGYINNKFNVLSNWIPNLSHKNSNLSIPLSNREIKYILPGKKKNSSIKFNALYDFLSNSNNANFNNKKINEENFDLIPDSINAVVPNADTDKIFQNLIRNDLNTPNILVPNPVQTTTHKFPNSFPNLVTFLKDSNDKGQLNNRRVNLYPDSNRVLFLNFNEPSKMLPDIKNTILATPIRLPNGEVNYVILNNNSNNLDSVNPFYHFLLNYNKNNNKTFNNPLYYNLGSKLKAVHFSDVSNAAAATKLSFTDWILVQIKLIEIQANITFNNSDKWKLILSVKNMLERNRILLHNNQQLCSLNGEHFDLSNLMMFPVFTKTPENAKILEIVLVKLSRTPIILGIIPLGKSTMPDILSTCTFSQCKLQPRCTYVTCTPTITLKYDTSKRINVPIDWSFVYPVIGQHKSTRSGNNLNEETPPHEDNFMTRQVLHNRIINAKDENSQMLFSTAKEGVPFSLKTNAIPHNNNNIFLNNNNTDEGRKRRQTRNLVDPYTYRRSQLDNSLLHYILTHNDIDDEGQLQIKYNDIEKIPNLYNNDITPTFMRVEPIFFPEKRTQVKPTPKARADFANFLDLPASIVKTLLNLIKAPTVGIINNIKEESLSSRISEPTDNTVLIESRHGEESLEEQLNRQASENIPDNQSIVRIKLLDLPFDNEIDNDDEQRTNKENEVKLNDSNDKIYNPKMYLDDDGELHIKILGGQAATSSGTPIFSKGRSGDEKL